MIDHDQLFKKLIQTFFLDFVDLFLPEVSKYLEKDSISFLDKEVFTDITAGESHEVDLIIKGRFKGEETFFLIHVEAQATKQGDFARRMFSYFARLYEKFDIPVYPVAIFSYNAPLIAEVRTHKVVFPNMTVVSFKYHSIQLNRLNWRNFVNKSNPIAAALMSKMKIATKDRVKVKIECLRLLATLKLDPARMKLISYFVDVYLRLTAEEDELFTNKLDTIPKDDKEVIMEMVTSWMEKGMQQGVQQGVQQGIQQGIKQGMQQGEFLVVARLLVKKLGELPSSVLDAIRVLTISGIEELADALLDFNNRADLDDWLRKHGQLK